MVEQFPIIVGPTAGGKSALAVALALEMERAGLPRGEVVSADSMQVFRGMDIGTGKLTERERAGVAHHLIDILDPTEAFSVDQWLTRAAAAIAAIRGRGAVPIVVGGTHLYARALLEGLFESPQPDAGERERLAALPRAERRAMLERIDPAAAARIHVHDDRRTIRALEVFGATGTPISAHQTQWDAGRVRADAVVVGIDWPTDAINRRINARVHEMIEAGLVAEARGLWERGALGPTARQALGYRQLVDHFEGACDLDAAVERIKVETRRFAKNQRTWLRRLRTVPGSVWLEAGEVAGREAGTAWARGVLERVVPGADNTEQYPNE
jgi:tRNA dimethylallyltransferase